LITKGEGIIETSHEKIVVLRGCEVNPDNLKKELEELLALACERDAEQIKNKLKEIVPEYNPQF
jgi:FlaA1/EpsC-like NDP-sugar epimerase